jgi:hypothetical protein
MIAKFPGQVARMKNRKAWMAGALLSLSHVAGADPIHAIEAGGYRHHDSGWVFPGKIEGFVLDGQPSDVGGSRDAMAQYAADFQGIRVVALVDVFTPDSYADGTTLESARAALERKAELKTGELAASTLDIGSQGLRAAALTRLTTAAPARALYFVDAGAWRVRIVFQAPRTADGLRASLETFVRAQRWDTLQLQ